MLHVLLIVLSVVAGGGAGYAFHRFVGCRSGACAIWSNPWASTTYGAVLGLLLSGAFR